MARLFLLAQVIFIVGLQIHNTAAENVVEQVCPDGWERVAQWCLMPSSTPKSWAQATSDCTTLRSHLVTIGFSEFNDKIYNQYGSEDDLWIGLVNLEWVDSSSYHYNAFINELPIPGDSKECTVMLSASKSWSEVYCTETHHYVCQKQAALANMAFAHSSLQSSGDGANYAALNAVDGEKDSTPDSSTCARTSSEANPWWFVDLEKPYLVFSIIITTLQECCQEVEYLEVKVGNESSVEEMVSCGLYFKHIHADTTIAECSQPVLARYIRIEATTDSPAVKLGLCEVEVFVHVPAVPECPVDYVGYSEEPGRCFAYRTDEKPWALARISCQQQGGDLARLDSTGLNDYFQYAVRPLDLDLSYPCFIGLTDQVEENVFRWVDGSLLTFDEY